MIRNYRKISASEGTGYCCTCAALCLHLCHTVWLAACGYINHPPPKKHVYFCIFVCKSTHDKKSLELCDNKSRNHTN